jgi:hypothetical protein
MVCQHLPRLNFFFLLSNLESDTNHYTVGNVIDELGYAMAPLREGMQKLAAEASLQPYYKWNNMWTKIVQDTVSYGQFHL